MSAPSFAEKHTDTDGGVEDRHDGATHEEKQAQRVCLRLPFFFFDEYEEKTILALSTVCYGEATLLA